MASKCSGCTARFERVGRWVRFPVGLLLANASSRRDFTGPTIRGTRMTQVHLAKALKLQKRLAGRYSETVSNISSYNSVLEEQNGHVDVAKLIEQRDAISAALIDLKVALYQGNKGIQKELYTLAEKKGEADMYRSLNTRSGVERHGYQNTEVKYVATVTKAQADAKVRQLESEVDLLQDAVDAYNHSTKVEIAQTTMDLAS